MGIINQAYKTMKTLEQWFSAYGESHQNSTNKKIHYLCVPAIFFSIVGLFMSIPNGILTSIFNINFPLLENWAVPILILLLIFYIRLSVSLAIKMFFFSAVCIIGNYYLGQLFPLWMASVFIFVIAWIGQFYGHKLEGKKPSFLEDLQFLLIGPAWVIHQLK